MGTNLYSTGVIMAGVWVAVAVVTDRGGGAAAAVVGLRHHNIRSRDGGGGVKHVCSPSRAFACVRVSVRDAVASTFLDR